MRTGRWQFATAWNDPRLGRVAFWLIALIIFGLTVKEFVRSRPETSIATADLTIYPMPHRPPAGARFAADAAPGGDARLWMVDARGGRVFLSPWRFKQGRLEADPAIAAGPVPRPLTTALITRWRGREAVVLISARSNGLHVVVRSLDGTGRLLASGTTPRSQVQAPAHRDFGLGVSTGGVPALVEVDRESAQPRRIEIQMYAGASLFADRVGHFTTKPGPLLDPAGWAAIPASVNTANVDLALVSIGRETYSHRLEIHVLLGSTAYRAFGEQRALLAPVPQQPVQAVIGHRDSVTFLYVIDAPHERIEAFPV